METVGTLRPKPEHYTQRGAVRADLIMEIMLSVNLMVKQLGTIRILKVLFVQLLIPSELMSVQVQQTSSAELGNKQQSAQKDEPVRCEKAIGESNESQSAAKCCRVEGAH